MRINNIDVEKAKAFVEEAKTDKSKEPATNTTPNPINTLFIFSFYLLFYDLSFLKI